MTKDTAEKGERERDRPGGGGRETEGGGALRAIWGRHAGWEDELPIQATAIAALCAASVAVFVPASVE